MKLKYLYNIGFSVDSPCRKTVGTQKEKLDRWLFSTWCSPQKISFRKVLPIDNATHNILLNFRHIRRQTPLGSGALQFIVAIAGRSTIIIFLANHDPKICRTFKRKRSPLNALCAHISGITAAHGLPRPLWANDLRIPKTKGCETPALYLINEKLKQEKSIRPYHRRGTAVCLPSDKKPRHRCKTRQTSHHLD